LARGRAAGHLVGAPQRGQGWDIPVGSLIVGVIGSTACNTQRPLANRLSAGPGEHLPVSAVQGLVIEGS
jgi:hypothetical protein